MLRPAVLFREPLMTLLYYRYQMTSNNYKDCKTQKLGNVYLFGFNIKGDIGFQKLHRNFWETKSTNEPIYSVGIFHILNL